MTKIALALIPLLVVVSIFNLSFSSESRHASALVNVLSSTNSSLKLQFDTDELQPSAFNDGGGELLTSFQGEGSTCSEGYPALPAVMRIVVVPPDAGLELMVETGETRYVSGDQPPRLFFPDNTDDEMINHAETLQGIYPAAPAVMSEPFIIRGVRLVKVTTYPVRYNYDTDTYILNQHIRAEILFTEAEPVNPAYHPVRRHRSPQFLKFIDALAINGDIVGRDDPDCDAEPEYVGHYLIVTHEYCLEYAAPFIEWRRRTGYKVDILSVPNDVARSGGAQVMDLIQQRYDAYLDQGIDPFDYILLIGDRSNYFYTQEANWVLKPFAGNSTWGADNHADYLFACLEGGGNDEHPDVGYSRWHSGAANLMDLAVGRTFAYEMQPDMADTTWFTRGASYSQHWGNNAQIAWHPTIHTNARWGEEVLQSLGYDDVGFYEDFDWDQRGNRIGPRVQEWLNEGLNVMMGRAENYYWDGTPPGEGNFNNGVDANTVFPINLCHSGHGEWCAEAMTRYGDGDNLKGAVAMTWGWGAPRYTAVISACWMECVNAIMFKDMPLGWGRLFGITAIENYFDGGEQYILSNRTEFDSFGDPAIQPWLGVPLIFTMNYPQSISPVSDLIEISVTSPDNEEADLSGIQVTIYAAGNLPDYDDADYADYDGMFMMTTRTGTDGIARFIPDEDVELEADVLYVSALRRDMMPLQGGIEMQAPEQALVITEHHLTELAGNEDGEINPGERFSAVFTVRNVGGEQLNDITAIVSSSSPWIEVDENELTFESLSSGQAAEGGGEVVFTVDSSCPDAESRPITRPELNIEFTSGEYVLRSAIKLTVVSPHLEFAGIPGGQVIPDSLHVLDIEISNVGHLDSSPLEAELVSLGIGVNVVEGFAAYPRIESGETSGLSDNSHFSVSGSLLVPPGSRTRMMLIVTSEQDFIDTTYFDLQVMEERANAPQGPDAYGYMCFDDSDTAWAVSPNYDWIEISVNENDRDYDGELLEFEGRSNYDIGESIVFPLPFQTQFYGTIYDTITICTNGFISVGSQPRIVNGQNWPLDRAIGGGVGMIAPYWDWLEFGPDCGVYTHYDEESGRLIIEWYNMRHLDAGNTNLIFEVILHDRALWQTESGDQNIIFQYRSIDQIWGQQEGQQWEKNIPYASVGISSTDGKSGISYTFNNEYPVNAAPLEDEKAILFSTSPRYKACILYGSVTDFASGQGIERAIVSTSHGFTALTDENGDWRIPGALAELNFDITALAEGFNDSTQFGFEVMEDDSLEINYSLLHAEFSISDNQFRSAMYADSSADFDLVIRNDGNGPLNWFSERIIPESETGIGRRILTNLVGPEVNDLGLEGVTYVDGHFYVSGQNGQEPNMIYVFDENANLEREFQQVGDSRVGMLDLAYGNGLLWGSGERDIYGFNTDGEAVTSFLGPYANNRSLAYDSDRDVIWIHTTNQSIVAMDLQGEWITALDTDWPRISGLAYWDEDPDGFNLYVLENPNDNEIAVHKINPETNDTMFVRTLQSIGIGQAGGAYIGKDFYPFGTIFIVLINDFLNRLGDRIEIWQMGTYRGWVSLDPAAGNVEPETELSLDLRLDSRGLIPGIYEADLVFSHSAAREPYVVDVSLEVYDPADIGGEKPVVPLEFGISSAYPNPFNSILHIDYAVPRKTDVRLAVYNISGRMVKEVSYQAQEAGVHSLALDGGELPSGLYMLRLSALEMVDYSKILLIK